MRPDLNLPGQAIRLLAPAKLNLRLKVLGRRPADGYHLLSMLNVPVSLYDTIDLRFVGDPSLELRTTTASTVRTQVDLADPAVNLAARAFEAVRRAYDIGCGAQIHLHKEIPIGAGLGGGSSDAGAVLRFFRSLLRPFAKSDREHTEQFDMIARSLGADVPYCMHGAPAAVGGIGERISELPQGVLSGIELVLILPPYAIPTAEVFGRLRSAGTIPNCERDDTLDRFCRDASADSSRAKALLDKVIENDLQAAAAGVQPQLTRLIQDLRLLEPLIVCMSGSGSALFAVAPAGRPIRSAEQERLRVVAADHGAHVLHVRTLEQSPPARACGC